MKKGAKSIQKRKSSKEKKTWTVKEDSLPEGKAAEPLQDQNVRFTTVLSIRQARNAERVARLREKFAFYHSFERPTFTFCVKGRSAR